MENNQVFLTKIRNKVASLEFLELREALKEAYNAGITGYEMIKYGILEGIKCSGDIGLMIAAEALSKELPQLTKRDTKQNKNNIQNSSQKVVIGTVQGDIHDFGKNILIALLESSGIDIEDLGVDVPPERFLSRVEFPEVKVIAISSLLSITADNIKQTIDLLDKSGFRNKIKIIIGGSGTSQKLAKEVKADAYAKDAVKGLDVIKKWVSPHE